MWYAMSSTIEPILERKFLEWSKFLGNILSNWNLEMNVRYDGSSQEEASSILNKKNHSNKW